MFERAVKVEEGLGDLWVVDHWVGEENVAEDGRFVFLGGQPMQLGAGDDHEAGTPWLAVGRLADMAI